jgi:protein-L-isoaspartate(D-aspartate) O-methyltransferase
MDELDLIRTFRRHDATPDPIARAAARERLLAHIAAAGSLGETPGLVLDCDPAQPLDHRALYAALSDPGQQIATGVRVIEADLFGGLGLWLAMREPAIARLGAIGAAAASGLVPALVSLPRQAWTAALLSERALAVLVRLPVAEGEPTTPGTFEIGARALGAGGDELAERLARRVRDWHAQGRPSSQALIARALATGAVTGLGSAAVGRRASRFMRSRRPAMCEPRNELQAMRDRLVDRLASAGHIPDERVAEALRAVLRHAFLPELDPELAYRDEAHVTACTVDGRPLSSSSQPAIMAVMLGQLALERGQRVLEIGAGSGYNAALIAHLVGDRGSVTTVEIDPDIAERAQARLAATGFSNVTVVCGDGAFGSPERAPYDRIIVTAATGDLAPAWQQQLAERGRLVVPLALRSVQRSIEFERADGHLASVSVRDCGFMPLRGALAEPDTVQPLGPDTRLLLQLVEPRAVDRDALYAALARPGQLVSTGIRATVADVLGGLSLWLALREPGMARLATLGTPELCGLLPPVIAACGQVWTRTRRRARAGGARAQSHGASRSS